MKDRAYVVGLAFLFGGLVLIGFNINSGLNLSADSEYSAEFHLIRALGILFSITLGTLLLMRASSRYFQAVAGSLLDSDKQEDLGGLSKLRSQAFGAGLGMILLSIVSLITGTISHAGSFPFLHGVLGFGISVLVILSLALWVQLGVRLDRYTHRS